MKAPWQPAVEEIRLADVLDALSDPVRLEIVGMLAEIGTEDCSGINSTFDVHKSTLSHHYRVLRETGVTWTVVVGRNRLVSLRRDDLQHRFPGLLESVLAAIEVERFSTPAGAES